MNKSASMLVATLRRQVTVRPIRGVILLGFILAVGSLLLSGMTYAGLSLILPLSAWGDSAGKQIFGQSDWVIFFVGVLYIPLLETLLAQVLPIEIIRRVGGGSVACIVVSALLFGGGHYLNGGLAHGLTTLSGGLVFAFAYVFARPHGFWAAFISACTAHIVHNFFLLFVAIRLFS
ncbi:CPBP family intramembrane metalloprotease [Undibacterium amnicola]|uniref:CPBP family intramembrane metalloprotease n=1 Tax=Undibacterium amnicola TaxID=1834038 RepID=A0ABR6XV04_9BURK|nr:CPBP family glutamic-type intramembrane protease [Undibacterium amnicola]MBC3833299.1 CPBP family intramembrane metalloprotease [Undibacterium amnicola]